MNKTIDYETDFSAWALHNAQLLREGKFAELDVEHLIEELEDMGNNRQELANRFIILIAHLLKWEYQPDNRSSSWKGSINEQRVRITRLIRSKPGLKPGLLNAIVDAYGDAVELASDDTSLAKSTFPTTCPYSPEQLLEKCFFPENK
jgi:hypothetical protein